MKHDASQAEIERCKEAEKFGKIDAAFRNGDLVALRASVDSPDCVPNGPMPLAVGPCLEYAIYHSPLSFIRTLLEIGADPNPTDHAGFPPLIAALSCSHPQPGSPGRRRYPRHHQASSLIWRRPESTGHQRLYPAAYGSERTPYVCH